MPTLPDLKLKPSRGERRSTRAIAQHRPSRYLLAVTTISLKLPAPLLTRLEKASRARRTSRSSLVRECLEKQLPLQPAERPLPHDPPAGPAPSVYDRARPILKKAWARRGRGLRDLATHPKYLADFGK